MVSPRRSAGRRRRAIQISAFCTMTATACRMTTPRRPNGFGFPPTRATCRRRTISALCMRKGDGVPKDVVQAYMWFALSAAQGNSVAVGNLKVTGDLMTPAQIAAAKDLGAAMEAQASAKRARIFVRRA